MGTSRWREEELSVPLEDLSAWLNTLYLLQTQHDGELQGSNSLEDVELHQLQFLFSPRLMRHQLKSQGQILLLGLQSANLEHLCGREGFLQFFVVAEEQSPVGHCWGEVSRSLNVCWVLCWWSRSSQCIGNRKAVCAMDILKSLSSSCGFVMLSVQPAPGWGCYHCRVPSKTAQKLMAPSKSVTSHGRARGTRASSAICAGNNQQPRVFLRHEVTEGSWLGMKSFSIPQTSC